MAERYLLDSNAVSDILCGEKNVIEHLKIAIKNGAQIATCSIVYYEIERGLKAAGSSRKLKAFYELYANLRHVYLDRRDLEAVRKSSDIYVELHKGRQIEDNDIFIAAIAMVNDYTLITDNTKHFGRIEGIKIENWRTEPNNFL